MTAPTHYNGKPITPGTWLAHAAEVVGEQDQSKTAPTPDLGAIRGRATDATPGPWWMGGETMFARDVYGGYGSGDDPIIATDTRTEADSTFIAHAREDIPALLDAIAAVTAERDQALEALAATNKLGAFETGKTIGAAEVRTELDQARQMLADAPHGDSFCEAGSEHGQSECVCWKAGL